MWLPEGSTSGQQIMRNCCESCWNRICDDVHHESLPAFGIITAVELGVQSALALIVSGECVCTCMVIYKVMMEGVGVYPCNGQ